MKQILPAKKSAAEKAAHDEFERSDKQPSDYSVLASRLEAIARMSKIPRPDLEREAGHYRYIAWAVVRMENQSVY